jgi:hypothetical protein
MPHQCRRRPVINLARSWATRPSLNSARIVVASPVCYLPHPHLTSTPSPVASSSQTLINPTRHHSPNPSLPCPARRSTTPLLATDGRSAPSPPPVHQALPAFSAAAAGGTGWDLLRLLPSPGPCCSGVLLIWVVSIYAGSIWEHMALRWYLLGYPVWWLPAVDCAAL